MHRVRPCRLLVLALALCSTAPSLADDGALQTELKRHQGTWVATSSTFDGQKAPDEIVRSIKRIVTDDHVVWKRDGKQFAGTKIFVDASTDPSSIDVIPDGGRARGERILGIYKLDRDMLTICMAGAGQPRPKIFSAEKGSGCTLQTFERDASAAR